MSASFYGLSGETRSKQQNAGSHPCFRFNELLLPVEKRHQTEALKDARPTSHHTERGFKGVYSFGSLLGLGGG